MWFMVKIKEGVFFRIGRMWRGVCFVVGYRIVLGYRVIWGR